MFEKSGNYSAAQLLSDHCLMASVAQKLFTKMEQMSMPHYVALAAKLDEAEIAYPPCFCVRALLCVARSLLVSRTMSADITNYMFALGSNESQRTALKLFKAAAPRMQNIVPLSSADAEKVLADGLFGTILLSYMMLPDGVCAAAAAAETLRDACAAVSVEAATGSSVMADPSMVAGPSVMAGPIVVAGPSATLPAEWGWVAGLQDAATVVLFLAGDKGARDGFNMLWRVEQSRSGPLKLLKTVMKREPWRTMAQDAWKYSISSRIVISKIKQAMRVCAVDQNAWVAAATLIPEWKKEVRPGATTELEKMLWKVLLTDWANFDPTDQPGASFLLARLHLARNLIETLGADAYCLDLMEKTAP